MDSFLMLEEELRSWKLDITEEKLEKFRKYASLLVEANKVMNLTAITREEEIVEKHFLDSLSICRAFDLNAVSSLIDIGTGAGFPGIPLKIMFPHLKVVLLDSLAKRVGFLENTCKEIMLTDINAVHGRAEDFGRNPSYRDCFDLAVSRAVARLSVLSEYCLPFVKPGGSFISYKSAESGEELAAADRAVKALGGSVKDKIMLTIGPSGLGRAFYIIGKDKPTPKTYPRKAGTPAKKPIGE